MRVLVTGKNGQLATALAEAATADAGIDVVAMGRETLNICDASSVQRAVGEVAPDIIISAAAYTAVDKAETEQQQAFAANEAGPRFLAAAAAKLDIPIIHISTDYVFDGSKSGPYVEDDAVAPAGVYGASKLAGEIAVAEANPKHLIFRTAWVYSATGHNFVKTMLHLASDRDQLNVVDDQRGNPSYAPHLAAAILDVVRKILGDPSFQSWGVYHLAGTGTTTWCGLAREVFRCSEAAGGPQAEVGPITTSDYPTPAKRPANSQLDCSKAKDTFDVELPEWQTGVADCVARLSGLKGCVAGRAPRKRHDRL